MPNAEFGIKKAVSEGHGFYVSFYVSSDYSRAKRALRSLRS